MTFQWSTIAIDQETRPPKTGGPDWKWLWRIVAALSVTAVVIFGVVLVLNFSQGPTVAVSETVTTTVAPVQGPTTAPPATVPPEPAPTTEASELAPTTTVPPTTTTIPEPPLGATLVGESYVDAAPVLMVEWSPWVRGNNELFGVKISLPEGSEIRAPEDGYFNTLGLCPWYIEENLGVLDCMRQVSWQSYEPGEWTAGLTAVYVMATNLDYPPGIEIYDIVKTTDFYAFGSDFVKVEKGQLLATVASSQPFPIRGIEGENVLIAFYGSDVSSKEYEPSAEIAAAFFPAVAAPFLE